MPICKVCQRDTHKRTVLKRKALIDITDKMPYHPQVVSEFLCVNIVSARRSMGRNMQDKPIYAWFKEPCNNHIITQKIILKTK